jgi:hypothetical protein
MHCSLMTEKMKTGLTETNKNLLRNNAYWPTAYEIVDLNMFSSNVG